MKTKGLTLVEILTVVIIIGILASFIYSTSNNSMDSANRVDILGKQNNLKNANLNNLVSEWNFDGITKAGNSAINSDVKDSWGYNNGNVTGHAPIVRDGDDCVKGKCLEFNGSNYVEVLDSPSLNFGEKEFTISMWAKMNTHSDSTSIITKSNSCSAWSSKGYAITTISSPNEVYFMWAGTCCGINTGLENPDGSGFDWKYLTAIRKEITEGVSCTSYAEFYINGKYVGKTVHGACNLSISNNANLYIGKKAGCSGLNGFVDEVRLYNKALSFSEINNQYLAGLDSLLQNKAISQEEYNQRINKIAIK